MSARYRVKITAELIANWKPDLLPEGMRIADIAESVYWQFYPSYTTYRIATFEDDNAPEELNGKMVTPIFQMQPDGSIICTARQLDE